MDRHTNGFWRPTLFAILGAFALFGGCECEDEYDFPSTELERGNSEIDNALRVRFTESGVQFFQDNFKEVLVSVLGDPEETDPDNVVLLFNEPLALETGFSFVDGVLPIIGANSMDTAQASEIYPTRLYMDEEALMNNLTLEFLDGDRDGFRMRIENIPFGMRGRIFTTFPQAACNMFGNNPEPYMTEVTIEAIVYLDVGQGGDCDQGATECLLLEIEIPEDGIDLGDIDDDSIAFSEAVDSPHCQDGSVCSGTCDNFWSTVSIAGGWTAGFLHDLMQPILDEMFSGVLGLLLADVNGTPVGGGTLLNVAEAGGGVLKPTIHDVGLMAVPTGNAFDVTCPQGLDCEIHRGMDLTLKFGAEAVPRENSLYGTPHGCVSPVSFHQFEELYGVFDFTGQPAGDLLGSIDGNPYHMGISASKTMMNQALYAAYHTGALCLEIDSAGIAEMTGGAFALGAGTVDLLTEGRLRQYVSPNAPALLAVVPSAPPVIHLDQSEENTGTLRVTWGQLRIDFYVWMHDRYARVFGVNTDVDIGLKLFYDNEGRTLHLAIADGIQIENFEQIYNELLPEVNFNEILETLVGVALDAVLGATEFEFPIGQILADNAGVPIGLTLQKVAVEPTINGQAFEFLNLYLSMTEVEVGTDEGDAPEELSQPWDLQLVLDGPTGLYEPATLPSLVGDEDEPVLPSGRVLLQDITGRLSPAHEIFVQVDFGLLQGPFRPAMLGQVVLKNHKLKLVGEHNLRIWIQDRDEKGFPFVTHTQDFRFWVDPYAPQVRLSDTGDFISIHATDVGSPEESLSMRWREVGHTWSTWSALTPIPRTPGAACHVQVQVRDQAHNHSQVAQLSWCDAPENLNVAPRQETSGKVEAVSAGCDQSKTQDWSAFLLLLMLLRVRRRRIDRCPKKHT